MWVVDHEGAAQVSKEELVEIANNVNGWRDVESHSLDQIMGAEEAKAHVEMPPMDDHDSTVGGSG